ncbi:unnamed protein product [Sympodiomycopsis kandeliae]
MLDTRVKAGHPRVSKRTFHFNINSRQGNDSQEMTELSRYKDVIGVVVSLAGLPYLWMYTTATTVLLGLLAYSLSSLLSNKLTLNTYLPRRPLTPSEWSRRTVIITGGNGGVGRHLCRQFLDQGCQRVISIDILPPPTEEEEDRLVWMKCDLSSVSETTTTIEKIKSEYITNTSHIVLVCNAAIHTLQSLSSTPSHQAIASMIQVNLTSSLLLLNSFLPHPDPIHTVLTSSIMGITGVKNMEIYVASKYALVGLYESLSRHYPTSLILPAHIDTPLFKEWKYPWPFDQIIPVLSPSYVALRCVEQVHDQKREKVYLPKAIWAVQFLEVVPLWLKEITIRVSGSDQAVERMQMAREANKDK